MSDAAAADDIDAANTNKAKKCSATSVNLAAFAQFQRIMAMNQSSCSTNLSSSTQSTEVALSDQVSSSKKRSIDSIVDDTIKLKKGKRSSKPRLRNFLCTHPGCGKAFTDNAHLRDHMYVHSGEKNIQCPECNKCFARRSSLRCHQRVHTGEKPFVCPVETCSKSFGTRNALKVHRNSHLDKTYVCRECGSSFSTLEHLQLHMKNQHGGESFNCSDCEEEYVSAQELHAHKTSEHEDVIANTCSKDECVNIIGKFQQQRKVIQELRKQIRRLNEERTESQPKKKASSCREIPQRLRHAPTVAPLRFLTGAKPFRCMFPGCDKPFSNFYQLTFHAKQHRNVAKELVVGDQEPLPVGPKHCPVQGCEFSEEKGKYMQTLQIAKRHWQRHHQASRPFVCPDCPQEEAKTFKTRDNLTAHRRECRKRNIV